MRHYKKQNFERLKMRLNFFKTKKRGVYEMCEMYTSAHEFASEARSFECIWHALLHKFIGHICSDRK